MEFWAINHMLNGYFSPSKSTLGFRELKKNCRPRRDAHLGGHPGGSFYLLIQKNKKFRTKKMSKSSMTKIAPHDLKRALNTKLGQ